MWCPYCIFVSWLKGCISHCVYVPVQVFVFVFDGDGDDCNNDTHRTCAASMYHCLHEFVHLGHARYPLISCLYFHLYFCGEESYDSLTYNHMITFNKQSITLFWSIKTAVAVYLDMCLYLYLSMLLRVLLAICICIYG